MNHKTATARWQGNLKDGSGTIRFGEPDPVEREYTAQSRFESPDGFSPEELIAAAHAGCYSMALAHLLSEEELVPQQVRTEASVSIEEDGDGFSITRIQLTPHVYALGLDEATLTTYAEQAAKDCPVSKALAGAQISVKAILENSMTEEG